MTSPNTLLKTAFVAILALMLGSCSDNVKELSGSWITGESRLQIDDSGMADCRTTSRLTFTPNADDDRVGDITITTDIAISDALPATDSLSSPYEITVTGQASVSGTYEWVDGSDDEIYISLDPKSLKVKIDPDGVEFVANLISGTESPVVTNIDRTAIATRYKSQVSRVIDKLYSQFTSIDDMDFQKTILSCEINDQDYVLRRVTE